MLLYNDGATKIFIGHWDLSIGISGLSGLGACNLKLLTFSCPFVYFVVSFKRLAMYILISYDITKNKTRTKLAKKLLDFGPRVQKSVFEADINEKEMKEILALLKKTNIKKGDSIRLYKICESCKKNVQIWGSGKVTEDKEFYIQ